MKKQYSRKISITILSLLLCLATALPVSAQHTRFSATEQASVSVPTPGLFSQSNAFNIDFSILRDNEYSFPLPVGKATVNDGALEITTTKGDAVKAMFNGTVRLSRRTQQYGNTIVIRHDNGLETVYSYNAQNLVNVGQRVRAGQTIAIVGGEDGRTFCLFSIMVNGGRINPETILEPKSHRLRKQILQCRKTGNHVNVSVLNAEKDKALSLDPDDNDDNDFNNGSTLSLDLKKIEEQHWSYPLPGAHVISPYGGRGGRSHSGVDIKTKPNDKVLAAFDGVVTQSGPYFGYGNYIVIRHAFGFSTCYSHQSKNLVKAGQKVKAGEVIGLTGQTGRATTPHLHFEIRFCGRTIDPSIFFDHANHTLKARVLNVQKGGRVR